MQTFIVTSPIDETVAVAVNVATVAEALDVVLGMAPEFERADLVATTFEVKGYKMAHASDCPAWVEQACESNDQPEGLEERKDALLAWVKRGSRADATLCYWGQCPRGGQLVAVLEDDLSETWVAWEKP